MNFNRMVVKPSLLTLITAGLATAVLVFLISIVAGESRSSDLVALNQWLARDVASQFSGAATKSLSRAQRIGELVRRESGTFDPAAQREFDADPGLKAVWVLDAAGQGPLQPLARMDREGFALQETSSETVRGLVESAVQNGSAARGLGPGVSALALKLGDMPRAIVLFFDETFFARANGGPWGDKWMLIAPAADVSSDVTSAVLAEANSELREGTMFPSLAEIMKVVKTETPSQERTEFTGEVQASSGGLFQVSGVQTGAFGVMAVAVTPLDGMPFSMGLLVRLSLGIAISFALLVMLVQTMRYRRIPRVDLSDARAVERGDSRIETGAYKDNP